MDQVLRDRVSRAMSASNSLADALDDALLGQRNGETPSVSIGSQFWCVVGARESYSAGIAAGGWAGFSCSIGRAQAKQRAALLTALERSRALVLETLDQHADDAARTALAYDLLEHEAQHQGQLIRYFYTNGFAFPPDFAKRYALQQPAGALV
ncbi:MAG: hypothetical protein IIZ38_01625 [Sphingomonas sp.]|uniref:hypothetical protein n=1 Tax=unclassified Sphingomonas TaxID=196159 RepID=UPI0024557962|nr:MULTISPECIES: hypothetical protein [unclassified Sphingomonas]MBQ1496991.1 hypothetical protein [Sphingomonas sp.]MDH4746232.1 hypothetical protein [Sphingomonas sp. CBMAI 2297]